MPRTNSSTVSPYDRTKEHMEKLEEGVKELFSGEKYKAYLDTMSRFHNYSSRNIMLIKQQMPHATKIASYNHWKETFNRQVKKGEKGIKIFAPVTAKPETVMMEKLDEETGAPLLDKDGKVIMEEMTALTNIRFKLVSVFDVSQTHGEPLPELVEDLTGNVSHYEAFLYALKEISPLPIEFEPMPPAKDGYCRFGDKIGIREDMSQIQTVAAIVHEITHARLHDKNANITADNEQSVGNEQSAGNEQLTNADNINNGQAEQSVPKPKKKSKKVQEIEAESVAYVVCQKYNIETGANSFGYLAEWGSHDMREIKASLEIIRKEANRTLQG